MRILIAGGHGFVGKNLHEGLKDKYKIFAPFHKELDFLDYNAVENYLKDKKIDIVINAAVGKGEKVLEDSLRMFYSLLRNISRVDKIIHFGSGAEYAKTRDMIKVKESEWGRYIPQDAYGLAKYVIHETIKKENKIVNLRLFGIYGKYEDYRFKFISNSIVKNLLGQPIKIKQNVVFDYLYIDDLLPTVDFFLNNKHNFPDYNVTPTKSTSLTEIATIINSISLKQSKISVANKKNNFQYTADNARLKKQIPNLRFTSYERGISDLMNYYKSTLNQVDKKSIIEDLYFINSKVKK